MPPMPKLPKVKSQRRQSRISPAHRALYVASALAHGGSGKTAAGNPVNVLYYLGQAVRPYLDAEPDARAAFIKWYEKQP